MDSEIETDEVDLPHKLAQLEQLLAEYESKLFLNTITLREVDLSITKQEMMAMHSRDLLGLCWDFAQYAMALQRERNKHQSRNNWAHSNLTRILNREALSYSGYGWQEKTSAALADNSYAQKLDQLKEKSRLALDRLEGIAQKVEFLSKLAKDMSYSNRMQEKEYAESGD